MHTSDKIENLTFSRLFFNAGNLVDPDNLLIYTSLSAR